MVDILNFWRITSLALADAVNPCVLAILAIVLITILIQNPEKKKKVLYGGLAFTLAVYIGYLFYGLIIVQFFKTFDFFIRESSRYIYKGLAIFAMLIGALNIKDFFIYKKGGLMTEMPIWMRPKAKKLIQKITSAKGAFFIGLLVTIFLLPCTIGPLFIASGLLSKISFIKVLYWLLYYNLLFVLPMLIIVGMIYYGFAKINEVSGWKEMNIRKLHLIAGILLFLVGFSLLMGWL